MFRTRRLPTTNLQLDTWGHRHGPYGCGYGGGIEGNGHGSIPQWRHNSNVHGDGRSSELNLAEWQHVQD
jgi:hypothetical protein